jgi:hypothetical protein
VRRLVPLLVLPLLAACTSSPDAPAEPALPAQSAFAEGTCRTAAPDLLELAGAIRRLGEDRSVDPEVQTALQETQRRLVGVSRTAGPELEPRLTALVQGIGAVRIRAVGNTYEPALGQDLQATFDDVLSACVERG